MNNSHYYNTRAEEEDYRNIPIANLDNVQPLGAPTDKVSPLDVAMANLHDEPSIKTLSPRLHPHQNAVLPPNVINEREECLRLFTLIVAPIHSAIKVRPGLVPWAVGSVSDLLFSWQPVSYAFYRFASHRFGIDNQAEADAYHDIFNKTAELGKTEEQCIAFGAAKCKEQFRFGSDVELEMVRQIHQVIDDLLHEASEEWKQCMTIVNETELALQEINFSGGMVPYVEENGQCTAIDLRELNAIAGGELRQDQDDINAFVKLAVQERDAQFAFIQEWGKYNVEYFFGELPKLEADLMLEIGNLVTFALDGIKLVEVTGLNGFNGIIACVSPNGESHQCKLPNANLSVSLEQIMRTAKGYIEYGEDQMQMAAMVIATLVDRYDWAVDQIELFVRVFSGIRNILGRPFDLALRSFGTDIDLDRYAHLLPGALYVSPDLQLIDQFPALGDYNLPLQELASEIDKLKRGVSSVAGQVSDELEAKVIELLDDIRAHFVELRRDYRPPKHQGFESIDKVSKLFFTKGDDIVSGVAARINNIGINQAPIPEADEFVPPTANIALDETSAQVKDARAKILPFSYPTIPWWVWPVLEYLHRYFWAFDYLRRFWKIIRGFRQVWERTDVPVPIVNMPTTAEKEVEENGGKCWTVARLMTHDRIPTIVKYVIFTAIAIAIGWFYTRLYTTYSNGCVQSHNGTYLGREFLTSVVLTPIVFEVNRIQETEAASVEGFHRTTCDNARIATVLNQVHQSDRLASLENSYNKTMSPSSQLLNCIDFESFGGDFESDLTSCSLPLDVDLGKKFATCNWGECVVDCDQATVPERVQRIVIDKTCVLEEQWHAEVWLFVLLVYAYFSLQMLSSAIKECPSHLFPETFGSGELLGAEGEKAEKAMDDAIVKQLRWNKIKTWAWVLFVLLLNAAWIAVSCNIESIKNYLM